MLRRHSPLKFRKRGFEPAEPLPPGSSPEMDMDMNAGSTG